MLVKKFEETQFRQIKEKFLSRSVIDFSNNESKSFVGDGVKSHIFRDILPDKFISIFESQLKDTWG